MALTLPPGMNEYYGKNVVKMGKLLEVGEVPGAVFQIGQARIEKGSEFPDLWKYFDSSDLPIYEAGNENSFYTLLTVDNQRRITDNGRRALELIRSDNLASNYGVIVPDEFLEELKEEGAEGGLIEIPLDRVTGGSYLTRGQISGEMLWNVLFRNSDFVPEDFAITKKYELDGREVDLLTKYVSEVESRTGQSRNMSIYVGNSLEDKTTLKAWCVIGAGRDCRSLAYGGGNLVGGGGRFAGLAPEALGGGLEGLEGSIMSALSQGKPFEYQGKLYVPVEDERVKLEK